jgi:hypothetical protein
MNNKHNDHWQIGLQIRYILWVTLYFYIMILSEIYMNDIQWALSERYLPIILFVWHQKTAFIRIGANMKSPNLSMALSGIGMTFTRNGLGVGISTVFEIVWANPVRGGWNHHVISWTIYYQIFFDKRNKNACMGLGMGISTVFEILGHFLFREDRTVLYGHDLYTIRCSLTQRTRIYMNQG